MIINNNNNDIVFEDSGINNEFSNNMDIEYNMYPNQEDQQYEGYSDDDEERERKIKELQEKKMREHEERIEKLNALKREEQRKREQEEREKREKEERNRRIIEEEKRKIEEQKKLALQKIQSNYEEKLQKLKSKYQDIDDFDEDYNQSLLSDLSAQLPQPDSNQLINQNQNQNFEFQNQQENIENSLNESIQQVSQNRPGQQIIKQSQFSNNGLNLQNNDDNNNNVCYIGGDFQMEKDIQNIQNQNRMSEIDKKNSDLNMNLDSSSNLLGYQKQVKDNKMDLDLNQENQNQQLNKNQQEKSIKNNIDFDDIMGNYEGQEVQETQNNEFTQPNFNTNSDIIVNDINKKQSFNLQEDLNNKEKQKKQYLKLSGIFESDSDENLYTKQEKTENEVQKNKGQLENIKDINNYQINSNKLSLDQQKQQLEEMKQKLTQQQQKNTSQNINNQIQKISQNKEQNQQTQKIQSASKGQNIDYSQYDDNLIEQELEKELEIQDKQLLKQQLQQEQQLLDSQIKNKFKKQENIQMEQVKGQLLGQLNEEQNKNKEDEKQKEIEKKQKQQELENKKNMLLEFQKFAQQKQPTNNNINQQNTNQIQQLEQEKNNLLQHNQLLNEKRKLEQSLLENNLNKDQSTKIQGINEIILQNVQKKNKQNESQVGIQNTKTSYTTPEKEQSGLASLLNQQLPQGQEGKLLDLFSQEKNQNQNQKQKSYFSETHLQQQQQSLKETLFDEFLDDSLTIKKKTKQNQNQLEYIPKKHKRKNNFHKEKYQASPQQDSFSRQKKKRLVNFDNYQQQFGLRLLKKREKKKKRRDQEKREREEREKKKKEKEKKEKKEKEKRQREKEKSSSRQNRSSSSQQKQSKDQKERERSREIEIEKINKINEKARQEKSRSIQRENQPLQQQFQQQQNINQDKEQKIEKIESKSKDVSGSKVSMSKENTDGQKNQEFQKLEDYKKQLQSIFNNTKPQQQNDAKENNNQIQTQQLQQKIQKQQQTLQGKKVHLSKEERLKKLEEQLKKQMMEQVNQVQQKFTQPQSQNLIVMLNKDEIQQDFKNFATQKQKKYEYLLKKYMKKIEEEIDRIFENSNYSLSIVLNDLKSKYLEDKCIENALINQDTRFFQLFLKMLCYWLRDFHEDLKEDIINNLKCCSKKMISVLNRFLFYNQLMAKPWTEQQRLENKMLTQNQSQNYQITQPYIDLNMDQSNYENSENQMEQSYYYNYTNNTANQSAIYTKELNEYENKMKIFRRDLDKDKKNIEPSKMRENQGAEPQKKDKKQGTKVVIPNNNNLLGQQDLFSNLGFLPKKKEVDRIKGVQQEEKEGKRRYEHEFLGNLDPIQKKVKLNKENEEQNQESDMKSKKKKMVQNQQQQDIQGLQADLKINVNKDNVEKIINDRQQAQIESEQLLVENLKNSQIEQEIPYDFQEESEEIDSMEIEEDQNQEEFKNRYQDDEEQKYGENLQEEFNNIIRKDNVLSKISKSKTELIDFLQINCLMILEFNFPLEEREMDWEDDIQEQKQQLQMIENQEEQKEQNISQKNQQKQIQIQQLLDENLHEFQKQFNINNPLSPETFNEFQQLQKNQKNLELQLAENGFQLLKLNPYVANEQGNLYLQESIKINGNNKFICLKLYFPVENPNKLEINIENRKIFPPNLQMLE
ncbi:hypothetical protein PPERSA_07973 [Pseudocohnilembus persalinus]|uniref:Uncharacterized protein n=1 Tax=Pseudocohnilembus persalinus TaxID=266149 RepID=A0A0V0QBB9_PSEPJ|nr:hypothetical protein PPERSA_07973 [Pseudocohnilembus persalinus]|eukprot:KRW99488.1 hypothetical protein PPERSA_07973 [Pseudocohnilembus persalinus]